MKKNKILGIVLIVVLVLEFVFLFIPFFTNKSGNYSPITSYFRYYLPLKKSNFKTTLFLAVFLIEVGCSIAGIVTVFKEGNKNKNIEAIGLTIISILFLFVFVMSVGVPKQ